MSWNRLSWTFAFIFCRWTGDEFGQAPQDAAEARAGLYERWCGEAARHHCRPTGGGGCRRRLVFHKAPSAPGLSLSACSVHSTCCDCCWTWAFIAVSGPSSSVPALPNVVTTWGGAPTSQAGTRPKRKTANYSSSQPCRCCPRGFLMTFSICKLPLAVFAASHFWDLYFSPLRSQCLHVHVCQFNKVTFVWITTQSSAPKSNRNNSILFY